MEIIWTIIIGFVAGLIAKLVVRGPNEPRGFILTTVLGIVGAFVATYLGQGVALVYTRRRSWIYRRHRWFDHRPSRVGPPHSAPGLKGETNG